MGRVGNPGPRSTPAGGKAGQILYKNTSTDYDASWVYPSGTLTGGAGYALASGNWGSTAGWASTYSLIAVPYWNAVANYVFYAAVAFSTAMTIDAMASAWYASNAYGVYGIMTVNSATGLPGTVLSTSGTSANLTTTNARALSSAVTVTPGWYYLAMGITSTAGQSQFYGVSSVVRSLLPNFGSNGPNRSGAGCLVSTTTSGLITSNPTISSTGYAPLLFYRTV